MGGELPVASTLISENTPTASRGRAVVLLESFWAAGWLVASLLAYFVIPVWGWRVVLLITSLPAIYTLVLRKHVKQEHEPTTINRKVPFMQRLRVLFEPAYRQRTIMLWLVWFLVVFSYYGMFLWLPSVMVLKGFSLVKSFEYVLIMTLAQLPGYFVAAWLIEKWGAETCFRWLSNRNSTQCIIVWQCKLSCHVTRGRCAVIFFQSWCVGGAICLYPRTISCTCPWKWEWFSSWHRVNWRCGWAIFSWCANSAGGISSRDFYTFYGCDTISGWCRVLFRSRNDERRFNG